MGRPRLADCSPKGCNSNSAPLVNTPHEELRSLDDAALVDLCQKELPYRSEGYEELVRRYEPQVFQTCRNYLGGIQEAEEASQDILLRVFHGLKRFQGNSTFKTWIYRVAMNVCATRYAKRKEDARRRELIQKERADKSQTHVEETEMEAQELGGPVGSAMKSLPDDDRQILILRHTAELSFDELSAALGLKLSATKMRLYRAEERFREAYAKAQAEELQEKRELV